MLTSQTHPIRVDFVPRTAHGRPGQMGMTLAPGKQDAHAKCGAWQRDLVADLDRLREVYRADLLISLVEDVELQLLGIPGLVRAATVRGLEVVRHPIPDGHPPEARPARELVARILGALDAGRTVVVHCRGGLGRAGTVAAAALIASGLGSAKAIEVVRGARRGAIETPRQEAFLRAFALV